VLKWMFVLFVPLTAFAEVHFTASFESGKVQQKESSTDGFWVHTLPNPQSGTKSFASGSGGFVPSSGLDTRVVPGETWRNEIIRPRAGSYFVRSTLHYDKNYAELNGGLNKPRSKIYMTGKSNTVPFDQEGYLGFSLFLPKSWEHETGSIGDVGKAQLLQVSSVSASHTLLTMKVYVPKGKSEAHWFLVHHFSDSSVRGGVQKAYDLGPVKGDLGKWTDFVLRYRFNPFSTKTDARSITGGKDQVFQGHKGILQLWKAHGAIGRSGNRPMYLTSVNLVNKPVGLVPSTKNIIWHFRIYKGAWHKNRTSVKGPIWVGFDEIRDGRVSAHGTSYKDVHPGGLACTDKCSAVAPNAMTLSID
jgi:hypothetical protein